jgi:hypothetical protein
VPNQNATDDVLVEFDAESARDLLADLAAAEVRLRRFISTTASTSSTESFSVSGYAKSSRNTRQYGRFG